MDNKLNKGLIYNSSTLVIVAFVIGILGLLNWLVIEKFDKKFDLSQGQKNSISKEAKVFLKTLDKDINIKLFSKDEYEKMRYYLEDYEENSDKIKVEVIDLEINPGIFTKYKEEGIELTLSSLIIESGDKKEVLDVNELYGRDYATGNEIVIFDQKVTGAISLVMDNKDYVIGLLKGHGEKKLDDTLQGFKYVVDNAFYKSEEVNLVTSEIPKEMTLLAIFDPKNDINPDEAKKISEYLKLGGRLFLSLDLGSELPNLNKVLSEYNVRINNNVIIEEDPNMKIQGTYTHLLPEMKMSQVTSTNFTKGINLIISESRSLSIIENSEDSESLKVESILSSSSDSWGLTDFKTSKKSKDDMKGPLDIGITVEKTNNDNAKTKIIVLGDTSFMETEQLQKYGSGPLLMIRDSLKWLGERSSSIAIPEKTFESKRVTFTSSDVNSILALIGTIPFVFFGLGIAVWFRRKKL